MWRCGWNAIGSRDLRRERVPTHAAQGPARRPVALPTLRCSRGCSTRREQIGLSHTYLLIGSLGSRPEDRRSVCCGVSGASTCPEGCAGAARGSCTGRAAAAADARAGRIRCGIARPFALARDVAATSRSETRADEQILFEVEEEALCCAFTGRPILLIEDRGNEHHTWRPDGSFGRLTPSKYGAQCRRQPQPRHPWRPHQSPGTRQVQSRRRRSTHPRIEQKSDIWAAMGGPTERSVVFGQTIHHVGETDHRASLGRSHVENRSERFFDLNSGGRIQDEKRRMCRSVHICSHQLDL